MNKQEEKSSQKKTMLNQIPNQAQTSSPIIQRLVQVHEKNQNKQLRAQNTNHSIVEQYEKFKKCYEQKNRQKQVEVVKKMSESKKNKIQFYKKQSLHVEKIIEKFRNQDKRREINRLDLINKRNHSAHKRQYSEKSRQNSLNRTQNIERSQPRVSSSINDIEDFYKIRYLRISEMCEKIRKKSIQKQDKAELNRKSIQQQNKIKQTNQAKLQRKRKAEQQFSEKQKMLLRKSVTKLQLSDKRNQQSSLSLSKRNKNVKERTNKNLEDVRKRRSDFQQKLNQRLAAIQKKSEQKQRKISTNKQNYMAATVENKKSRRLQKIDMTMKNYTENKSQFSSKMSDMYKKDREQWGFLTGINLFKQVLIQKNVYQNSQLSLLK